MPTCCADQAELDLPVRCLMRPRAGDFLYMPEEIEMMCAQITELRSAGANGFVIGCLNPDGTLDCTATARLAKAAQWCWAHPTPRH